MKHLRTGWLLVMCSLTSLAKDNVWQPAHDNARWRTECGACHMAFPPGLLASDDWLDIMAGLDKHFGVDASVDVASRTEISDYLKQNAASNRQFGSRDEVPRITTSEWFVGKHRSAIRLWVKGKLKSLSECDTCHKDAGLNAPE